MLSVASNHVSLHLHVVDASSGLSESRTFALLRYLFAYMVGALTRSTTPSTPKPPIMPPACGESVV
jgi:hypothetical protein